MAGLHIYFPTFALMFNDGLKFCTTLLDIFCTPERCSGNSWLLIVPEQRSSILVFHPSEKMSRSVVLNKLFQ